MVAGKAWGYATKPGQKPLNLELQTLPYTLNPNP